MSQYNDILKQYRLSQSIKGVAAVLNISEQTVRRTLITAGLYTGQNVFNSYMWQVCRLRT